MHVLSGATGIFKSWMCLFLCRPNYWCPNEMQGILQREIYDNPNKTSLISCARCVLAKCIWCIIGYLFGLIHLIPANYRSTLHGQMHSFYSSMCKEVCDINVRDIILGFVPVFLFIKSYASFLVAELSQLCYKGVLRTIALGSTDGLCTWRCTFVMGLQPVIVPVGRIALGRIKWNL